MMKNQVLMIATEYVAGEAGGVSVRKLSRAVLVLWWTPHRSWNKLMHAIHGNTAAMAALGDDYLEEAGVQDDIMLELDVHVAV